MNYVEIDIQEIEAQEVTESPPEDIMMEAPEGAGAGTQLHPPPKHEKNQEQAPPRRSNRLQGHNQAASEHAEASDATHQPAAASKRSQKRTTIQQDPADTPGHESRPHAPPHWLTSGEFAVGEEALKPQAAKRKEQHTSDTMPYENLEGVHHDKQWSEEWELDPRIGTGAHARRHDK